MKRISLFLSMLIICSPLAAASEVFQRVDRVDISSLKDDEFLDLIEKKAFEFFWFEADLKTGLIKDRANNFGRDNNKVVSTASVGFGLTAVCIGEKRGWITHKEAYARVLNTLKFYSQKAKTVRGFFYHFLDINTGKPTRESEASSIDTALFLAGALFCAEFYKETEVEKIAKEIYLEVDWNWMLNGGTTLSMGWKPSIGFIEERWSYYCEAMLLYLMAIGSPTHPIPAQYWYEWERPIRKYKDYIVVASSSLFTHQYSHLWVDFRNKHDNIVDYFWNSIEATRANRQFCIDNMDKYKTYGPDSWGLTACDGPEGYKAYGARPSILEPLHDGTIATTAAGGSVMFTPEESISCLRSLYNQYKDKIWGIYGFSGAFNIDKNWFASDVIGIDQGAILLSIENYRSGMVWEYFMRNEYIRSAMQKAGFQEGAKRLTWETPIVKAKITNRKPILDANLNEWIKTGFIELIPRKHLEYSSVTDSSVDVIGKFYFMWDDEALYIAAEVIDNEIIARKKNDLIYKDDCIEIFIDPKNDEFIWEDIDDFQFGFAPVGSKGKPIAWEWFHRNRLQDEVSFTIRKAKIDDKTGYVLEAEIKWDYLGVKPHIGYIFGISPAIHDIDMLDNTPQAKLNWFYIYQDSDPRILLGKILLEK